MLPAPGSRYAAAGASVAATTTVNSSERLIIFWNSFVFIVVPSLQTGLSVSWFTFLRGKVLYLHVI